MLPYSCYLDSLYVVRTKALNTIIIVDKSRSNYEKEKQLILMEI